MALTLAPGQVGSLRAARRAAGLTQQTLAERAGCSISYVRLIEQGFAPTSSDVLPRIADALTKENEARAANADLAQNADAGGDNDTLYPYP